MMNFTISGAATDNFQLYQAVLAGRLQIVAYRELSDFGCFKGYEKCGRQRLIDSRVCYGLVLDVGF